MTETLGVADWMKAPATRAVMAALEARGGKDCARFVGGAVRNAVMGQPVQDVDIATTLLPGDVIAALKAADLRAIPTGVEHGTVTAICDHTPFEVTTLRRDVETDGRRAVVAFTTDWVEDAQRRDFRFNALYADAEGRFFDPTGGGLEDARAGRVVFVGDPETRLREDYLRILRFFRFHAWYGRGKPGEAAVAACGAMAKGLAKISAERINKELMTLLRAPDPRAAVKLMEETSVLAQVLPVDLHRDRLDRLVQIDLAQRFEPDPELRLAALLAEEGQVAQVAKRIRLSKAAAARLALALAPEPKAVSWLSAKAARRALWQVGGSAFRDRLRLAWAEPKPLGTAAQWRQLMKMADGWQRPALPVGGRDALAIGLAGTEVGEALGEVEAWWIDHDFPADRKRALEALSHIAEIMRAG